MLNSDAQSDTLSNLNLSANAQKYFDKEVKSFTFCRGEVIVHKGEEVSGVYIVQTGALRIYTLDPKGIEKPIDNVYAGEICLFSVDCIMKNLTYPAWLKIDSSEAKIKYIPASAFRQVYVDEPSLRDFIFEAMSRRIYSMMSVIEETLTHDVGSRINHFLLRECPVTGVIELSHQDIADRVGTSREVVSKHLKSLEKLGYIKLSRLKIIVNSSEELAKLLPRYAV